MQPVVRSAGRRRLGACFAGALVLASTLAVLRWVPTVSAAVFNEESPALVHVYANGEEAAAISTTEIRENSDGVAVGFGPGGESASLFDLALLAGISPEGLTAEAAAVVTVTEGFDAGYPPVTLSKAEVLASAGGLPSFYENSLLSQVAYEQPGLRLGGRGPDAFHLEFSVAGELLKVNASCTEAKVGEAVACTAEPKEDDGSGWTYTWEFGDETPGVTTTEETAPPHTYTAEGTYKVDLTVKSEAGSGARELKVRVGKTEEHPLGAEHPPGPEEEEPKPVKPDDSKNPAPTSEPNTEQSGSGEAPPESISTGPDQSPARHDSKGTRHRHDPREAQSGAIGPGTGGGAGAGTGTGVGGGSESGGTAGPGAADPDPDGAPFDAFSSKMAPAPRARTNTDDPPVPARHPSGRLIEGLVLRGGTGLINTPASAARRALREQQPAAGGQGSGGGSVVGPLAGVTALLIALGAGGGFELISAGRRRITISGAHL